MRGYPLVDLAEQESEEGVMRCCRMYCCVGVGIGSWLIAISTSWSASLKRLGLHNEGL